MKKLVLVLSAVLFLLPSVAVANQFLAVIVSGHNDQGVNSVFGVNMTRALVQTGMFRETPRYDEFMTAVNAERQRDENRIVEIARRFGIQSVCFTTVSSVLGSNYITARIVSTETGAIMASGNIDSPLATLADIRNVSETLVGTMTGTTPAPAPTVAQPAPQVQTFNQPQQFQQAVPQAQFQQPQEPMQQQMQFQQPQMVQQQQIIPMQAGNMQVIQLQPGEQILIVGAGTQQNFIPQQQTFNLQQQQLQTSESSGRTWKERWIYVGGTFGVGWIAFERLDYSETFTSLNAIADFPLLAPVLSLETQITLGNEQSGLSPLLRIGYISEPFEITFDAGTFIGTEFGIPLSATVGFKVGPGMAFTRYQIIGSEWFYIHVISAGYKIGVGPRRNR